MNLFFSSASVLKNLNLWDEIATRYANSVFFELFAYLRERVFSVNFGVYENISLGAGSGVTARNLILGIALGLLVAAAVTVYVKAVPGGFVRALLRGESLSRDRAKTLRELGFFRSVGIRRELARDGSLCRVVRCVEKEDFLSEQAALPANKRAKKPFRVDFRTARFYIPDDLRYRAEVRYDRGGSDWRVYVVGMALVLVAAVLLCRYLPAILSLADLLISLLSP